MLIAYLSCSDLQHQCVGHCCRLLTGSSVVPAGGWAAVAKDRGSAARNEVLCFPASNKGENCKQSHGKNINNSC